MRGYKVFWLIAIFIALIFSGCTQQKPEKVPVIEVNFSHYVISGQHVVKINSVKKKEIEISKVRITKNPPFPSIIAYAIYPKNNNVLVSPVAYTSIRNEGDDITLYIGIEKKDLPEPGTKVNVFVEVWSKNSKKLAADKGGLIWR